jgi:hypothetical protein
MIISSSHLKTGQSFNKWMYLLILRTLCGK